MPYRGFSFIREALRTEASECSNAFQAKTSQPYDWRQFAGSSQLLHCLPGHGLTGVDSAGYLTLVVRHWGGLTSLNNSYLVIAAVVTQGALTLFQNLLLERCFPFELKEYQRPRVSKLTRKHLEAA